MKGLDRRRLAIGASPSCDGVTSRDALQSVGLTYVDVRTEVRAGRWRMHGLQTVALHSGPLGIEARRWRAVWETGVGVAALDGVTALQAVGLRHFDEEAIHVSVVHTARVKRHPDVRLHTVIRRVPGELAPHGVPRTRPAVAALRGAYWAASDRQAALILIMTVQQGLATAEQIEAASLHLRGRRRRALVTTLIGDIADGIRSLGELDFARMCRVRGMPEPSRQVVRRGPRGRIYLDVRWEGSRLVVEIDGAQHREGLNVTSDNLSRNAVTLENDRVLRIDLIGLRLFEEDYLRQVATGLTL